MQRESKMCNGPERVPTCSTWPPPWVTSSTLATPPPVAEPTQTEANAVAADLPADLLAELHREVNGLMDLAWANAWTERLRTATYADLAAVRRSIRLMLDLAAERHRAGDADGFRAWRRFIIRHVRGELWNDAASRQVTTNDFEIVA